MSDHLQTYARVNIPGHPRADKNGDVAAHVVVAERALGRYLPGRHPVHHVDRLRGNNDRGNLVICQDAAYHQLLHLRQAALDACGKPDWRKCIYCKQYDDPARLKITPKNDSGMPYHADCALRYSQSRQAAPVVRLPAEAIAEIVQLLKAGATQREIAARFGCAQSTVWRIQRNNALGRKS